MTQVINKEIEINSVAFVNKKGVKSVPRKITVDHDQYSFIDSGLQYLIQKGQQIVRLFDMTDGQSVFRLRLENDHWTLVNIRSI